MLLRLSLLSRRSFCDLPQSVKARPALRFFREVALTV